MGSGVECKGSSLYGCMVEILEQLKAITRGKALSLLVFSNVAFHTTQIGSKEALNVCSLRALKKWRRDLHPANQI